MNRNTNFDEEMEYQLNIYVSRSLYIMLGLYILVWLANEMEIFHIDNHLTRLVGLCVVFILAPAVFFTIKYPFKSISKVKYILVTISLLTTLIVNTFLLNHTMLILAFPLILAVHYHSRKLNLLAGIGSIFVAMISPILAFKLSTIEAGFYEWLLWVSVPDIASQSKGIMDYIGEHGGFNVSPALGVILFIALPNALICCTYAAIIYSVFKARNRIREKWAYQLENVNQEKEQALELADAKSQFLSTMSHEIRTPLNAIIGMNTAILRESGEPHIINYASDVDDAGKMLLSLINDILDYSKLEEGKTALQYEDYRIDELISFCEKIVKTRAEDKGLRVIVNMDKNLPSILNGDVRRIKQIVINLLTNAVKYTQEGQVRLSFSFDARKEKDINLVIRVADTGEGIKEEDIGKLFNPFDRINENGHSNIEGTGIGLPITKKLIDLMEGSIEVNSTYGKGSIFTVKIPQEIIDNTPVDVLKSPESSAKTASNDIFTAPDAHILVVDDVALNIKVARALLASTQVHIDEAHSGDECIQMTLKKKYNIILLDHSMPGKDGIQTLKEIRALKENPNIDTPIVALTANYSADAENMYKSLGFEDYLAKPFTVEDLQRTVAKYVVTAD